jgi:adenylate kinase
MKDGAKGLIFSGSPRTLPEAEIEIPKLESLYGKDAILVFKLHISAEESVKRNSQRLFCEYSHPIRPEIAVLNPTICPDDGGKVIRRALDDPEVIKVRLKEYESRTVPAIEYIQKRGIEIVDIPGEVTIEAVAEDIWKALQKYYSDEHQVAVTN